MRIRYPPLIVVGLLLLAGMGWEANAEDTEPGDRVICVSKQINEFIYAIGAQTHLIARDLTSVYPSEIAELPSVGYHRALSAEGIISMLPTVFLTDGNVGPPAVLDRLREINVPVIVMYPGETVEDAQQLLTRLGQYFHRENAAAAVLGNWRRRMEEVRRLAEQWEGQRYPRVLLMHFGQVINNYLALGKGGPAEQILKWAGGENAIDAAGGMTRLTPELIAQAAPDVIIATDVGFDRFGSAEKFAELPGIALTPAGRAGRIYRIDETELMYFGPRTADAVTKVADFIHR
jgi:iron complex transport system substrate-binding protein